MTCNDCNLILDLRVCQSAAGYYVGRWCDCGPYSRETGYFATREDAESVLADMTIEGYEDGEEYNDYPEDNMTDAEADADTLASAGWGTDEDYGYYGGDE